MKFVKTHPTPSILLDIYYTSKRKDRETQYSAYMLYSVDYTALYGLEHQSTQFLLFVGLYHTMFHQQLFQQPQIQQRTWKFALFVFAVTRNWQLIAVQFSNSNPSAVQCNFLCCAVLLNHIGFGFLRNGWHQTIFNHLQLKFRLWKTNTWNDIGQLSFSETAIILFPNQIIQLDYSRKCGSKRWNYSCFQ